jgi:hypothetical protein
MLLNVLGYWGVGLSVGYVLGFQLQIWIYQLVDLTVGGDRLCRRAVYLTVLAIDEPSEVFPIAATLKAQTDKHQTALSGLRAATLSTGWH